ncbi:NADase-type glycan-binding domain-containing protein [Streptomyces adelaidensis]|uniref:NADase-type glycan-binding domain-containing protein n=1 Tax=Streptomyces adelaidensis TaxID=2796465 RepID=UPI0019071EAE|nr:zinc ribbon domain-containing protein [Streptomyces adelaidensis]
MTSQTPGTGQAQSCAECGTRGEPGQSFCDACGAVLGWSGAPDRPAADSAARTDAGRARTEAPDRTADPAPASAHPRAEGRTPGWDAFALPGSGTGTARTGHDPAPATPAGATAVRTDTPPPAAPEPATPAPPASQDAEADTTPLPTHTTPSPSPSPSSSSSEASDRARSLLVPVADPEPRAPAEPPVAPVLPGRPDVQRPQVRAPGPEFGTEGGIPCPWCGTPTRPDRHFCGRCAMPMAGRPQAPARLPWWRRMLDSRNSATPWAGDRPRLRRGFGHILNWLVGALVLALIVTLALYADDGYQATRDHFAKRAPVGPNSFKASRSFPAHGPGMAFDKHNNTWWGPGVTQSGEGEWVEARFEQPTRLLDVIITSGVSTKVDQLTQSALPQRIEARITAADSSTSTKIITLDQAAGGQRRKFRVADAVAVRFTVRSAYGADAKKQIAIAEIEFFGRSNSNS